MGIDNALAKPWKVVTDNGWHYIEDAEENVILDGPRLDATTATVIAVNAYERQREVIQAMTEALQDVESKIVDFDAGRINWRPDDFLMRVRRALAHAQELLTPGKQEVGK